MVRKDCFPNRERNHPSLPCPYSVLTGHIMKRAVDLREGREKQWEQTIDPSREKGRKTAFAEGKSNLFPTARSRINARNPERVALFILYQVARQD